MSFDHIAGNLNCDDLLILSTVLFGLLLGLSRLVGNSYRLVLTCFRPEANWFKPDIDFVRSQPRAKAAQNVRDLALASLELCETAVR